MRKLRQLTIAALLVLAVSATALAGIIGGPPEPTPEPPSATATGIIGTGPSDAQPVAATSDPVVEVALSLLQSVLLAF